MCIMCIDTPAHLPLKPQASCFLHIIFYRTRVVNYNAGRAMREESNTTPIGCSRVPVEGTHVQRFAFI